MRPSRSGMPPPGDGVEFITVMLVLFNHSMVARWHADCFGSDDGTAQIWDATTGEQVGTYSSHSHAVSTVVWSPDGVLIASGSYDKTVRVWDASTGRHVLTYRGHSDSVEAEHGRPMVHGLLREVMTDGTGLGCFYGKNTF